MRRTRCLKACNEFPMRLCTSDDCHKSELRCVQMRIATYFLVFAAVVCIIVGGYFIKFAHDLEQRNQFGPLAVVGIVLLMLACLTYRTSKKGSMTYRLTLASSSFPNSYKIRFVVE